MKLLVLSLLAFAIAVSAKDAHHHAKSPSIHQVEAVPSIEPVKSDAPHIQPQSGEDSDSNETKESGENGGGNSGENSGSGENGGGNSGENSGSGENGGGNSGENSGSGENGSGENGEECEPCTQDGHCWNYRVCGSDRRWQNQECDNTGRDDKDRLWWNPDATNPHGGLCDFWDNLSPAVQDRYQEDETCDTRPVDCYWRSDEQCDNKYFYLPPGQNHHSKEQHWSCPQGLFWDQDNKNCGHCTDCTAC